MNARSGAMLWKTLATAVAGERMRRGLTQAQLAALAGVHRVTICNLERERIQDLGIAKVQAILGCLGLCVMVGHANSERDVTP